METFIHEQQSHVTWKCEYHVVIVPKYRKKTLYGPVRKRAGQIMRELAKRKGVEVIEGNACPDHIHLVLSIPPRASVAQIIGFMKGKSAIRLHLEFGRNHNNLQQKELPRKEVSMTNPWFFWTFFSDYRFEEGCFRWIFSIFYPFHPFSGTPNQSLLLGGKQFPHEPLQIVSRCSHTEMPGIFP